MAPRATSKLYDALMTDSATRPTGRWKELRRVPLGRLVPSPDNDREELGDLTELVASIREHGIDIEPKVTPHRTVPDGHYKIVYGHRRHAAAILAGLTELQVIVEYDGDEGLDDDEIERQRGEENLSRVGLKALEEARIYERRARKINARTGRRFTVQEVADFFSKSQGHVSRRLALTQLPLPVQVLVDQGRIGNTDAYALSQLHTHPAEIVGIVDRFIAGDLGVSIERAVKDAKQELGVVSRSRGRTPRASAPLVEPEPPPAAPEPALPSLPPPPMRPRRERTEVTLQVVLPIDTYQRMVRAKLHGGRYGFARWAGEHLVAYIDERTPDTATEGEPASDEGASPIPPE